MLNNALDFDLAEPRQLIEQVTKYRTQPVYMSGFTGSRRPRKLADPQKMRKVLSRILGEKYNTPSVLRKLSLHWQMTRALDLWRRNQTDASNIRDSLKNVLYPLQLQPEANLDVWANEFSDQLNIVREVSKAAPSGWRVLVKPNPKSKYELLNSFVKHASELNNVELLPLESEMSEILPQTDLVLTITGTIAVECVFRGVPVLQLGPGPVRKLHKHERLFKNGAELQCIAETAFADGGFVADEAEKSMLATSLYTSSFPGQVGDEYSSPVTLSQENVGKVASGILSAWRNWSGESH